MFTCVYRHCVSGLGFGKGQMGFVSAAGRENNRLSSEDCFDCNVNGPHKRGIQKRDTIHQTEPEKVKKFKYTADI